MPPSQSFRAVFREEKTPDSSAESASFFHDTGLKQIASHPISTPYFRRINGSHNVFSLNLRPGITEPQQPIAFGFKEMLPWKIDHPLKNRNKTRVLTVDREKIAPPPAN
jgi:hypothetical protein